MKDKKMQAGDIVTYRGRLIKIVWPDCPPGTHIVETEDNELIDIKSNDCFEILSINENAPAIRDVPVCKLCGRRACTGFCQK